MSTNCGGKYLSSCFTCPASSALQVHRAYPLEYLIIGYHDHMVLLSLLGSEVNCRDRAAKAGQSPAAV